MKQSCRTVAVIFLFSASSCLAGAGPTKIDRSIGKQPAYQSTPKYCLVVYGREAKTRVWLVLDGDGPNAVLYADRNGDGDVTGDDERILRKAMYDVEIPARNGGDAFSLRLEEKPGRDGAETTYRIWCRPAKRMAFSNSPEGRAGEAPKEPPWLQKTDGVLRFAKRPQDAPIVHFGGPLTLTILDWHKPFLPRQLVRGKENELSILVGTPVVGGKRAAFVTVYEPFARIVGGDKYPVVDVEFSARDPGAKPVVTRAKMRY